MPTFSASLTQSIRAMKTRRQTSCTATPSTYPHHNPSSKRYTTYTPLGALVHTCVRVCKPALCKPASALRLIMQNMVISRETYDMKIVRISIA